MLTWVLNFGIALLVPEDIYESLENFDTGLWAKSSLTLHYLFNYWAVYLLTWTLIPVLQGQEDAGDLDKNARLKRSLRSNGLFYLTMLVKDDIETIKK